MPFVALTPNAWLLLAGCLLTIVARAAMMVLLLQILQQRGDLSPRHVVPRAVLAFIGSVALTQLATFLHERLQLVWLQPAVLFASSLVDVVVAVVFYRFRTTIVRIPNRQQLERKVAELEQSLEVGQLVERIALNAWLTSRDGVVVHASERAGEIFRCAPAQLLGRQLLSLVAPDSVAAVTEHVAADVTPTYEFQIIASDGELVWVEGRAAVVLTLDGYRERHATFRDMTLYRKNLEMITQNYQAYRRSVEIREKEDLLINRGIKH